MFMAQQYRAKSDEYESLIKVDRLPAETAEFRNLRRSYASLADNLEWLANNGSKTVQAAYKSADIVRSARHAEDTEQEQVLRCLGAAVILNWNTIPTNLQRSLFEATSGAEGDQRARLESVPRNSYTAIKTTRDARASK